MVKYLGMLMQRPFTGGLTVFEIDGKHFGVGTTYYDSTNTRKTEWYDMFFLGIYELTGVEIGKQSFGRGKIIEKADFSAGSPLAADFVHFTNTFGHLFDYEADGETLTVDSREKYIHAENQHIQRVLFSKVFNSDQQIKLEQMMCAAFEN